MSLTESALLVRLHRSWYRGNITDLAITDEVVASKKAKNGAGIFVKKLLRDNPYFSAATAASRAVDTYHKKMTVPWNDRAERLLPASLYFEYAENMRRLRQKHEAAVHEFVGNLGDLVQAEEARLGDAFNPADYPSADQLEQQYHIDLKFTPLQDPNDIRVAIPDEEREKIRQDCQDMFSEKLRDITKDLWVRLHECVKRMVENLESNKRIYNTMIGNICDLVKMLPELNVSNDPQLAYMAREIDERICKYSTDDIKQSEEVRNEAHSEAEDVLEKIDQVLKGWS